jgi:dienelactone hydrolase
VVVIHEMPGLHPGVVKFASGWSMRATRCICRRCSVGRRAARCRAILRSIGWVCVGREFTLLADRTSPIATWLRSLAAQAHHECGGPGVGAIGMCFTVGFALAVAVEPAVLAPVLSQPGLPAPLNAWGNRT